MKHLLLALSLIAGLIVPAFGQNVEEKNEKTLSPYFLVQNGDDSVEKFPLLETKAKVNIAGVIADVELTQVYKNDGKSTIEAVYVFPLGVKAAIHKMQMKIGKRNIVAKIEERNAAKTTYETAKSQGKVASLLEQERPNVFQMKVANIMPGDKVEVAVSYTELLVPESGTYEFVYPTVVGPRYGGGTQSLKETDLWIENPYLHEGTEPPYTYDISVTLNAGIPISKVWVPTHKVDVEYDSKASASIHLTPDEKSGGNRDFIVRYALEGDAIQTGLLLYPGSKENFFLLMALPPKRPLPEAVPAREYVFIVDVSGSMSGFPLEISKALVTTLINGLREKDYFNIMFFSGGSDTLSDTPLAANPENKARAIAMLSSRQGGGGTEILAAMKKVFSLEKKEGVSRTIVIATDGYVAVEKEVFELIRKHLSEANVFAFGIGTSVNRFLIEGMARVGKGEPFVAGNQAEANKLAEKFIKYVSMPLLTDISLKTIGIEVYDVEPVSIPDLFAQRPLIVYGKYKDPKGSITLQGKSGQGDYENKIDVSQGLQKKENIALEYLWARERIARLYDYGKVGEDTKDEVTKLGLQYSLMTEYTSFVAVDSVARNTGESSTIKQPLPLPEGVSDYAVGGQACLSAPAGGNWKTTTNASGANFVSYSMTADGVGNYETTSNSIGALYSPGLIQGRLRTSQDESKTNEVSQKISAGKDDKKTDTILQVSTSHLPAGVTVQEVKKQISLISKELEGLFKTWELRSITITLKAEKGKVIHIHVQAYQGKDYKQEDLDTLFKKLNFSRSVNGILEIGLSLKR